MQFTFKKIGSILASTAMLSSTVALAAAANFPAPFVSGGNADVAVVHGGADAAYTDLVAVTDVASYLSSELARQTATGTSGGTDASVSGEAAPLFTSGTKLYMNDSMNTVTTVLTDNDLPTVLVDDSFSGNVDATVTQTITLGFNPQLTFAKQPTSDQDPQYGLTFSTSQANYLYNATVTLSKAVNFSHADSEGQDITMFGQKFTIASATHGGELVLLKTAERASLTSDEPSAEVTIGSRAYTIELISASDTSATIKVTNDAGVSETKEVSENASKKIQGITVAVTNADETNFKLSATVIAGAEKVAISNTAGSTVKVGEDARSIDGTSATVTGGVDAATGITISIYAPDSDTDALLPGDSFVDPVFGSFKLDFGGLNIADDDTVAREEIKVARSADDRIAVTFQPHFADEAKTIQFAKNLSGVPGLQLMWDDAGNNITVFEQANLTRNAYVVVGNEEDGRLVKLSRISNDTSATFGNDDVEFTDVFTGEIYDTAFSAEGTGTVKIAGKSYDVAFSGSSTTETNWVKLNYPDSSGTTTAVIYPTIQTKKGALLAFYEPVTVNITSWDGTLWRNLTSVRFPDGDGYTDVAIARNGLDTAEGFLNVTIGGTTTRVNLSLATGAVGAAAAIGTLTFNFTGASDGTQTTIKVAIPGTAGNLNDPGLIIWEERDDNTQYHAIVVTLEPGATSDDGLGVSDVARSWQVDGTWDAISLASTSTKFKEGDLFGTIALVDQGDSDQNAATISYPDEQVYAQLYIAENEAEITPGQSTSGATGVRELGSVAVADTEVGSVSGKSLIVVGGSCVNSVAASLLGVSSPTCGAEWTTATGVGSGEYLIQTFSRTGGKVATLVAGTNAGDTTNAARALTTQTVDTTVGKKYKGTSATAIEAVMEETTATA